MPATYVDARASRFRTRVRFPAPPPLLAGEAASHCAAHRHACTPLRSVQSWSIPGASTSFPRGFWGRVKRSLQEQHGLAERGPVPMRVRVDNRPRGVVGDLLDHFPARAPSAAERTVVPWLMVNLPAVRFRRRRTAPSHPRLGRGVLRPRRAARGAHGRPCSDAAQGRLRVRSRRHGAQLPDEGARDALPQRELARTIRH